MTVKRTGKAGDSKKATVSKTKAKTTASTATPRVRTKAGKTSAEPRP